jgi:hypothetical protein
MAAADLDALLRELGPRPLRASLRTQNSQLMTSMTEYGYRILVLDRITAIN